MLNKRMFRLVTLGATAILVLSACSSSGSSPAASSGSGGGSMDALIAAAKAEGTLTTIALPHDWCNYGGVIDGFKAKYGLAVNELTPDAGSGDEVEAIKANKDNKGPQAPDVIDVGLSFGPSSQKDGLISRTRSRPGTTIPDSVKDPDGNWYGDYYGVMTFEVNTSIVKNVPKDWPDLLKPEYKGQVALAGDPRVSNQAIQSVYASALANGGSLDNAQPGLDFFKKLNDSGNFVPVIAKPGTIDQGATPITMRWTYNALAHRDTADGQPADRGRRPDPGPLRRRLRPGDQRLRAAPERGQAVAGVPLLRRGPAHLAQGVLHAGPLRRHEDARASSRPTCSPSCRTRRAPCSRRSTSSNKATELITKGWDATVGVNVK